MTDRAIAIRDEAHWHELRAQHVGGSEVAALFGEHAQLTPFELWHIKAGLLPAPDLSDNDRVFWGTILEPAIAKGVSAKTGWETRKVRRYYSMRPNLTLGGSLDYEIRSADKGRGVLEIKTADWLVAKRWVDGPPLAYELQIQSYLALAEWDWGVMAVLVGGNDLRLFEYERRPKTIDLIVRRVSDFWQSIANNNPPKPDFSEDHQAISTLYGASEPGKVIDLSHSNRLPELIEEHKRAALYANGYSKVSEASKDEIHWIMGDAEIAICGDHVIKAKTVKAIPDKIIKDSDVGKTITGRGAYRGIRINERKTEKAA